METSSRGRYVLRVSVFVFTLCLASAAWAQEASIIGQVTDDTGAVLPGVTIVATSPSLQVPQVTVVTDERGEYRLTPLPLGNYSVEYALEAVGLTGFEARTIGTLSGGQMQRMLFARVLLQDARLIVLDEPFNAIDAKTSADLLALVRHLRESRRDGLGLRRTLAPTARAINGNVMAPSSPQIRPGRAEFS